jgi:hypothetical protein
VGIAAVAGVASFLGFRRWQLRWHATEPEVRAALPGDEFIPAPDLTATRAITIHATAAQVWPWIAQLGQGRGGFYSYDNLENMAGCDIHSTDRIVPEWQDIKVGDAVRLAPQVALSVAAVDRDRALVLRGGVPMGDASPPYDFTWAFVLDEKADGTTRLLVRDRYLYFHPWVALLVEPVEAISFLMTQKMLRGIRQRAEAAKAAAKLMAAQPQPGEPLLVGHPAERRPKRSAASSRRTKKLV